MPGRGRWGKKVGGRGPKSVERLRDGEDAQELGNG